MRHEKEPRKSPPPRRHHNNHHPHEMKRHDRAPIIIRRRRPHWKNSHDSFKHNRRFSHGPSSSSSHPNFHGKPPYSKENPKVGQTHHHSSSHHKKQEQQSGAPSRHPWLQYRTSNDTYQVNNGNRNNDTNDHDDDSYLPYFSAESSSNEKKTKVTDLPNLDANNVDHAHKIQKRLKMISYGKNTMGYDEYLKQVPKSRRIPRKLEHPTTPDPTIDIPWRRFHGLVKAWRKALHMYDPADILPEQQSSQPSPNSHSSAKKLPQSTSIQQNEILQATQKGLQVEFIGTPPSSPSAAMVGELNRLELETQPRVCKERKNPRFTWYQSSDDESDMAVDDDKHMGDGDDSDDEIL